MAEVIHVNFEQRTATYTLELYTEEFNIRCERLVASSVAQAQFLAVERARTLGNIRSIMMFHGHPSEHSFDNKAILVMLRDDIEQYIKDKAESC